jgi:phosphatidylglycerophosphatase A
MTPDPTTATADPPQTRAMRPSWRFAGAHPAHALALGLGAGLGRIAPGTAGTLWAWAGFLLLDRVLDDQGWAIALVLALLVGWWAATVTSEHLQVADSSHIVCDEVVAFWLILWLLSPAPFVEQLVAFALFRLFDAFKWGPVRWADRHFKGLGWRGGLGIMLDDLVAAGLTLLVLAWLRASALAPWW